MSVAAPATKSRNQPTLSEHIFAPRFWVGMNLPGWLRLLGENHFDIGWQYLHVVAAIMGWGVFNSTWGSLQSLFYRKTIDQQQLHETPLFVLGHWRAGTTLLHEMMVLDERHTFPTTYACLAPNHFLTSESIMSRWAQMVMPSRRPMDNMSAGWNRPQEEEFALCNLGIPSPYLQIAFPNHRGKYDDYLTLENISPQALAAWKLALLRFLKQIDYRTPKRIVLKSPPHTSRISTLLEMFPDARFVHVVRDPQTVFASTRNLWRTLYVRHGLQKPTFEGLDEYVLSTFERMYKKLERDRALLRPDQLIDVRYEDLVADPMAEMETIYDRAQLGGFDQLRPKLTAYLASLDGYQTNSYKTTPEQQAAVRDRWLPLMQRYGYE